MEVVDFVWWVGWWKTWVRAAVCVGGCVSLCVVFCSGVVWACACGLWCVWVGVFVCGVVW